MSVLKLCSLHLPAKGVVTWIVKTWREAEGSDWDANKSFCSCASLQRHGLLFITDHLVFGISGWGITWVTKSFPQYILRPSVLTSYFKVNIGCLSKVIREKCFWSSWLIFWQLRFIIFRRLNVAGSQICWQTCYFGTADCPARARGCMYWHLVLQLLWSHV